MMANEALIFDADLSPLHWILNGIFHYSSINDPQTFRNIYTLGPNSEDWVSMTDPVGSIDTLIEMRVNIKNLFVSAPPPGGVLGVAFHVLKSDDTELGSFGLQMNTNFSPHEYNIVIPLVGTGADTTNMKFRIRSYDVGGWPVGQGVVQIYQINPTLYYTEPVLTQEVKHIEVDVSSGEPTLHTAPGEIELQIAGGNISLAAAPSAIELPAASGEIALQSEVVQEDA
jgi:hypothetical protein